ncbi:hypothetical protein [Caballeronia novacaledonica]|uniref:Uncharacterized protein n=1 Tax=Caballeronia novacaledonica TaxID=1544861 RepID=A0AA37IFE8_9BURK|nr:hypothetical protein [Caballeronia novacaledonica]GJH28866.1 hypothetical protein CBA19CS42_30140 [Caballeronia novacaledonica]
MIGSDARIRQPSNRDAVACAQAMLVIGAVIGTAVGVHVTMKEAVRRSWQHVARELPSAVCAMRSCSMSMVASWKATTCV